MSARRRASGRVSCFRLVNRDPVGDGPDVVVVQVDEIEPRLVEHPAEPRLFEDVFGVAAMPLPLADDDLARPPASKDLGGGADDRGVGVDVRRLAARLDEVRLEQDRLARRPPRRKPQRPRVRRRSAVRGRLDTTRRGRRRPRRGGPLVVVALGVGPEAGHGERAGPGQERPSPEVSTAVHREVLCRRSTSEEFQGRGTRRPGAGRRASGRRRRDGRRPPSPREIQSPDSAGTSPQARRPISPHPSDADARTRRQASPTGTGSRDPRSRDRGPVPASASKARPVGAGWARSARPKTDLLP